MYDDLEPADFEATALMAVEACAKAGTTAERAQLLAEAGLLGVLAPEDCGGLGLSMRFGVPIASAAGKGLLAYPLIETMVLARALAGVAPDMATALCEGSVIASIAWAGIGDDGVVGRAPLAQDAAQVLVFRADGSAVLVAIDDHVSIDVAPEFDLEVPEATLHLSALPQGIVLDAALVATLKAEAQFLRTAMVLGSVSACLGLASDYAQDRVQFGKLLSANQALRHRMSRDAVVAETLRSGLARALTAPREGAGMARDALWCWAAQAGPSVAESAIQVLGGMGFTWDVPLHRHLRRMRALAHQGAARERLGEIANAVLGSTDNEWYGDIADAR